MAGYTENIFLYSMGMFGFFYFIFILHLISSQSNKFQILTIPKNDVKKKNITITNQRKEQNGFTKQKECSKIIDDSTGVIHHPNISSEQLYFSPNFLSTSL